MNGRALTAIAGVTLSIGALAGEPHYGAAILDYDHSAVPALEPSGPMVARSDTARSDSTAPQATLEPAATTLSADERSAVPARELDGPTVSRAEIAAFETQPIGAVPIVVDELSAVPAIELTGPMIPHLP
jgi:hypothetical protein